jgi:hypothetical protein
MDDSAADALHVLWLKGFHAKYLIYGRIIYMDIYIHVLCGIMIVYKAV